MKVEIALQDAQYCNGCPFMDGVPDMGEEVYCKLPIFKLPRKNAKLGSMALIIRPQRCIVRNGK